MTITCQFGAFLYGEWQLVTSQYDAIPVRGVSVWRDASLARVTLTRFSIVAPMLIQLAILFMPVLVRTTLARIVCVCFLYVSYCLRHIFIDVIKVSSGVHYSERGNTEGVFLWLVHTFIN